MINDIACTMADRGGNRKLETARNSDILRTSVDVVHQFFSNLPILLIINNVWKLSEVLAFKNWMRSSSRNVQCPGSVVLNTTDLAIYIAHVQIFVHEPRYIPSMSRWPKFRKRVQSGLKTAELLYDPYAKFDRLKFEQNRNIKNIASPGRSP